ncbi:hypothetical protein CPB84DRAFT_1777650 [Gymnopilus junonius]|uniref:Uncharacterized protein n=1 Tax=Gymnopilus junonius TaxID=109634 RepID=A0A9P5NQI2_GYMJU|nr:hypothetical protein CPB84DRAFT_1777650 [Gymnopilus junonius]
MAPSACPEMTTFPCIFYAIEFLTQPLLPSDGSMLNLSFSSTSLPPRGRDFRLIIEPQRVVVIYSGPEAQSFILYSAEDPAISRHVVQPLVPTTEPQIIPEKFRQVAHANMPRSHGATIHSAILRSPSGTLAQHLLNRRIFDLISRSTILSPTPTRRSFSLDKPPGRLMPIPELVVITSPQPLSSPEPTDYDYSRPSSRLSSLSFSSDAESFTTASSTSLPHILTASNTTNLSSAFDEPTSTSPKSRPSRAVVNNANAKSVTKYLYQAGVSTVLTGGVMLGRSKPPTHKNGQSTRRRQSISRAQAQAPSPCRRRF